MATIGRLTVALAANSAQLAQDLDKARKNYQGWTARIVRRAKRTAKVIGGIATAAAAAFAAAGAAGLIMINRQAAEIDKMYKQASNLRLDLGDFQRLGFIAEQSGSSVERLGGALNRMNMALSQGTNQTVDALAGIGLTINQVMAMRPSDRFEAIAQAIRNTGDEAAQTRAQIALFGRSGGNMLNLINADFETLNDQFERMGITLTNAQGDMVAAYQDAKNRLGTLFTGFKQQFTAQMAGPLTRIVEWIEEYAQRLGGMDVLASKAAAGVINALSYIVESGAGVLSFLNEAIIKFKQLQLLDLEFRKRQVAIAGTLGFAVDESVFSEFLKLEREIEQMKASGQNVDKNVERMRELAETLRNTIGQELTGSSDRATDSLHSLSDAVTDAADRAAGMFGTSGNTAWDRIFGGPSNQENQRDYIPKAFSDAAKSFNDSLATGNMKTRETAMKDMQRLIDVAAGRRSETNFGSQRLSQVGDLSGMQSVFDRLQEMIPQEEAAEKAAEVTKSAILEGFSEGVQNFTGGVVEGLQKANEKLWEVFEGTQEVLLDLRTDSGSLKGKIIGSREFVDAVRVINAQSINNTARAIDA